MNRQNAYDAEMIADMIKPLLAGHDPDVTSAVLAQLTALWLAGYVIRGDDRETARMRKDLLSGHVSLIRRLIPVMHDRDIKPRLQADTH